MRAGNMRKDNRGSVLIFAAWTLSVLAVFAVYIAYMVNQKLLIVKLLEESEDLHFIAEAGVKSAILELKTGKYPLSFVSLGEDCTDNPGAFKDIPVGKGVFSVSYQKKDLHSDSEDIKYGFIDEERKININHAPALVLARLLQTAAGVGPFDSEKIANAILDYRDQDEVSADGAPEAFEYSAKLKDLPFEVVEELTMVPQVTHNIFDAVKDYVTVYGDGRVNINTAPGEVLEMLGLKPELVKKIIQFRAGKDGIDGTADDNRVEEISSYMDAIGKYLTLNAAEKSELEGFILSGTVSTRSQCVLICSKGVLGNKKRSYRICCVYDLSGKIRHWAEAVSAN